MTSFTKEVNPRLAKRPLKINGRWANLELTSLVREATDGYVMICAFQFGVLETTDMLPHLQDEESTVVTLVIARDTRTTWSLRHDVNQEQTIKIIAMMTSSNGNIFPVTGPLCGEITGHRWIPLTKPSNPELWCFLWFAPEQTVWVINQDAGDLRRRHAHYDVTAIPIPFSRKTQRQN